MPHVLKTLFEIIIELALEFGESSRRKMSWEGAVGDKPKGPPPTVSSTTDLNAVRRFPKENS